MHLKTDIIKKSSILNTYLIIIEPRCEKTDLRGFPTRHHTNRAVLPQKTARGFKFRIKEVEGLYYLCSENKGADQIRGKH